MMLYEQKVKRIVELLDLQPYWRSKVLADKLKVSQSTIQRCLQDLHEKGLARRVHGGIQRVSANLGVPVPLKQRAVVDLEAKERICVLAMEYLPAQGYVYLDAGTTTLPLAQRLDAVRHKDICVVTNDVSIATVLSRSEVRHILLSGTMHSVTQTISGPITQRQICSFNFGVCFISVDGISMQGYASCALADEAMLKHQAIMQSQTKILMATAKKWDIQSGVNIDRLDSFDIWIVDNAASDAREFCKGKVNLRIAGQVTA